MTPALRTVLLVFVAAYLGAVSVPCLPAGGERAAVDAHASKEVHHAGHAHGRKADGHAMPHAHHANHEHREHRASGHGTEHAHHGAGAGMHRPRGEESTPGFKAVCPCGCDGDAPSPATGQRLDRGLLAARPPIAVPAIETLGASPAPRWVEAIADPPDTVPILSRTV